MQFFKAIYKGWMTFAHALGWVNTRIILSLVYFFIFTPVAFFFRLVGNDPMDRRLGSADSYWIKKETKVFKQENYRRQF